MARRQENGVEREKRSAMVRWQSRLDGLNGVKSAFMSCDLMKGVTLTVMSIKEAMLTVNIHCHCCC